MARMVFPERIPVGDYGYLSCASGGAPARFGYRSKEWFIIAKPGDEIELYVTLFASVEGYERSIVAFPTLFQTTAGESYNVYENGSVDPDACDTSMMTEVIPGTACRLSMLATGAVGRRVRLPFVMRADNAIADAGDHSAVAFLVYARTHVRQEGESSISSEDNYHPDVKYGPASLVANVKLMTEEWSNRILGEQMTARPSDN